jgi:hypothetical protein
MPSLVVESPELGEAQNDFFQKKNRPLSPAISPPWTSPRVAWERAKALLRDNPRAFHLPKSKSVRAEYKAGGGFAACGPPKPSAIVGSENLPAPARHVSGIEVEELAKTGEMHRLDTRCTRPIDGQVVEARGHARRAGQPRSRGTCLVLADTNTLWVLADVPEARLHEIAVGATRSWVAVGSIRCAARYEGAGCVRGPVG